MWYCFFFFFSSRRRHTRYWRDWSSDVCSSDLIAGRHAVLLRPVVALAVHRALHERIPADDPLRLTLREVDTRAVAAKAGRSRECLRLREQRSVVPAPREPHRECAQIPPVAHW